MIFRSQELFPLSPHNSLCQISNQNRAGFFTTKKIPKRIRNSAIQHSSKKTNFNSSTSLHNKPLTFSKFPNTLSQGQQKRQTYNQQIEFKGQDVVPRIQFKVCPPKRRQNKSKLNGYFISERNQNSDTLEELKRKMSELLKFGPINRINKLCIQKFIILERLGSGSFSTVFKILQVETQTIYALKIINKEDLQSGQVLNRLIQQIKIQTFLDHPCIIKLYGWFNDEKHLYLIQEFVSKDTLYALMKFAKKQTGFTPRQVAHLIKQLCQAVQYLHRNSIIHRDIKPENILVFANNHLKLTDFGCSVYNPQHLLRKTVCGTPLYLSPELICSLEYDESVDLWAIGVLTFQLLTGHIPFKIKRIQDLINIVTEQIDLLQIQDPLSKDFIYQLLTKDMRHRKRIQQICRHPFLKFQTSQCAYQ